MFNPYQTQTAEIISIKQQADFVKLFKLKLKSQKTFKFTPGQMIVLSVPGFGEAPFALCNSPESEYLELSIRKVGRVTEKLHSLKIGEKVGLRGPYGQGWPVTKIKNKKTERKNLLLVAGGLGIIPLRPLILAKNKPVSTNTKIQVFYGARTVKEFLFKNEFKIWQRNGIDLQLTVDKKSPDWKGQVGPVTTLFDKFSPGDKAIAFLCGPPIMYKFVLAKLKEYNFANEDIYLSLERRMHCGIGVCQHCAIGTKYVCKDGPVFRYSEIKDIAGAL